MIDDFDTVAESGLQWRAATADVHLLHPSRVEFGFRAGDLAHLAELEVPGVMGQAELADALTEVLDDAAWIDGVMAGAAPTEAPAVRMPWRTVALIEAAQQHLTGQIRSDVLDLDRALALERVGAHDLAREIAVRRSNTIVEVAELLHDAGIARDATVRADLVELLMLADLRALSLDVQDTASADRVDDDAVENIFRDVLTAQTPPAVWNAAEIVAPSEHEIRSVWRTKRRLLAAERSLTEPDDAERSRHVRMVFADQLPTLREELGARTMKHALERASTAESDGDPEPLLAELLDCLLTVAGDLEGSLREAAHRDAMKTGSAESRGHTDP